MRRLLFLTATLIGPQPLWAQCAAGETVYLTCQIEGRKTALSVCYTADTATYRYGPINGKPELVISTPMAELIYEPWAGFGRTIWENVRFENGGYSYDVGAGTPKLMSEADVANPPPPYASVTVQRDDKILAQLDCKPDTLVYEWGDGISAAKDALGLEWDQDVLGWVKR